MRSLTTLLLAVYFAASNAHASKPLDVPESQTALMTVAAHGVQVYECKDASEKAPSWVFIAPEADLFDANGVRIGRHGAGPFWQHEDGSRIVGTVRGKADAPQAGNIPWLLLESKQQGSDGVFSRVTSVQRVNTVGGLAPTTGCSVATVGKRAHIAYRAEYVLHVPRS